MRRWSMIVRNILGCGLLAVVWLHSHWSVALSISLLYWANEIRSITDEFRARLRETHNVLSRTL
jgi:hypothetical protein